MRVFLIHGLGRTPASMWLLGKRLEGAGHPTRSFGYWVTQKSLPEIAQEFASVIRSTMAAEEEPGAPFAVIGHSLGNIITRFASQEFPEGFERFIMLAPPNQSPAIARFLKNNPVFRMASRDAGQSLATETFYEELPIPAVPSLVIAGSGGPKLRQFSPWEDANDGVVRVDETRIEGAEFLEISAVHTFLMNRRDVLKTCLSFLDQGTLSPDGEQSE